MSKNKKMKLNREKQLPDFRTDGPPLFKCRICGKPHRNWNVNGDDWNLLPREYRAMILCEEDFLRLVNEAGHDTSHIQIERDKLWKRQQELWEGTKDLPAHYARIRFPMYSFPRFALSDTLWCEDQYCAVEWCEVTEIVGDKEYVAQLLAPAELDKAMTGNLYLTKWDGEKTDPVSGRPVLDVIQLLSSAVALERAQAVSGNKKQ